jgi:DNA-binding GntR family transcriptional regulator
VDGGPERGQFHHKRILVAIEEHDPKAARKAMRAHLKQVLEDSSASAKSGSHLNAQANPHVKPNS